jgi:hypothetical protein
MLAPAESAVPASVVVAPASLGHAGMAVPNEDVFITQRGEKM